MFVGLMMILVPVEAADEFRAIAYDCTTPASIKQFSAEAHCKNAPQVSGKMEKVKILQHVTNEQVSGFKCEVTAHSVSYYCGFFSYSKPILSAEREQSVVISAQSCSEMATRKVFITPQGRKSESIIVPGRTYIMEFSIGFQTASNSEIKCQGQDTLLDGSIQKGIVQHVEYKVQVTNEIFDLNNDKITARSSAELLACNPRGPALGCVGALHTYAWSPPRSSCQYRLVREVEGLTAATYFAADEAQLYYDLKRSITLPPSCGSLIAYPTSVQDIVLVKVEENPEAKLIKINPLDVSYSAEIRSLSLFLRYKLDIVEGNRLDLGTQIICETSTKEPGEAPPHRIGNGLYLFRRGDIAFQYSCVPTTVEFRETTLCYADAPIHSIGKFKFMSTRNRMLLTNSAPEPCVPNFSRVLRGVSHWIRIGPKLKVVPPPRSEPRSIVTLKHHADEVGLYTEQEEKDFEHVSSLKNYQNLVTGSLVHAICSSDDHCDLNPLPGTPSYSLSRLENEVKEMVDLGPWEYFLVKVCAPLLEALRIIGCCGGFIYAMTWVWWLIKLVMRMSKVCLNKPKPEPKFPASVLLELMGDSRPPEVVVTRRTTPTVRYRRGSNSDDDGEVDIPLTKI